jgi:hypothetical protein
MTDISAAESAALADLDAIEANADSLADDDEDGPQDETIRAKWTIDGAATLAEAAVKAREFADHLQALHDGGYVLRQPVEDDYAFYFKPERVS